MTTFGAAPNHITLENPVAEHFEAFVAANASQCRQVVQENACEGQHLVICGAGPSLNASAPEWCAQGDQVWGVNSALPYLLREGFKCTHGFAVDQTTDMIEEWATAPDVEYMLASTCHPHLVDYLQTVKQRRVTFFHNFVGIKRGTLVEVPVTPETIEIWEFEDFIYRTIYPTTVRAGSGLNAVTRAIDVGFYMGFKQITVLGADCAIQLREPMPEHLPLGSRLRLDWLRANTIMHADGGHALASRATPMTLGGSVDAGTPDETIRTGCGRHWETKPDMIISAVWLLKMARKSRGRLRLIGDTFPNALKNKSNAYLLKLPCLVDGDGTPVEVG